MFKNKMNFKLLNMAIFLLVVYLLYITGDLWRDFLGKIWTISFPFLLAFTVAYALYPFTLFLRRHRVPKVISNIIAILFIVVVGAFLVLTVFPVFTTELTNLFSSIIATIKELSLDYDLNLGPIQDTLSNTFNEILSTVGRNISTGAINFINRSINFITILFISFSVSIYFLYDMDKIRDRLKKIVRKRSKRTLKYLKLLDVEMRRYLSGFIRIALISLVEYGIAYMIIGHPSAFLLAVLAAVANLIPYFGGILNNTVAAITAFAISPALFIRTLIAFAVLSLLDGYVINPLVYGKTNKIHPILVISAVFAGGIIGGIIGIIISLPVAIIILTTYKFYKNDIYEKIEDIKENMKEES
jgi:Predicted permease